MVIRRIMAAVVVLLMLAACDEGPTLVLPSGVSTSIVQLGEEDGTPAPLGSSLPVADAAAACITLTIVDNLVVLPDESPPAESVDPQLFALQIGTLAEDLHQVALQTTGSVAAQVETISKGLLQDKAAIAAGHAPERAWLDTYAALHTDFAGFC